jgi:basic membrane protein A and related proteins
MKRVLCIVLVLLLILPVMALASCASNTYELAMITDVGNIDDKSFNESAWIAVKSYAEANKITYAYYKPSEDSTQARIDKIKAAVDKGAKIIVCPGYLFEEAIFNVQDTYPNVQFLLLDGEPHNADYSVYKTASNVHCILYQEEQAGYLAGYAVVMDGFTKLAFLGGKAVPAVVRYGYGYIQGAEAAAAAKGLAAGAIEIKYWYSDSFVPNDDIKNKVAGWYTDGTEIVFACGGGIFLNATAAAQAAGKKVVGVDKDQGLTDSSGTIITSAMKDLTNSVTIALKSIYANKGKWDATHAGKTITLGAKEDCVGLPTGTASWKLTKFTVAEYDALFKKLVDGSLVVSNDIANKPATSLCMVEYLNQ